MKCCQIKLIEGVKNFFILHIADNLMKNPSATITHISPQCFYMLIVSSFATYRTRLRIVSICMPFIKPDSKFQTYYFQHTPKKLEVG